MQIGQKKVAQNRGGAGGTGVRAARYFCIGFVKKD
jgi:hypothetical protein